MRYPDPRMNLLRRAASETVRELGINVPTAVTVIAGIGFAILITEYLYVPETASVSGFVLWLIKGFAWIASIVVVFIPLLARNAQRVAGRKQSENAFLRMAADSAASVDDQMKSFLRNALSNPSYGVAKCYAFGSVVGQHPTRDVDIVIQFDSSNPRRVRTYRDRLRSIESSFHAFHGQPLHVQTFLSAENAYLSRFLDDAGVHERLI